MIVCYEGRKKDKRRPAVETVPVACLQAYLFAAEILA